MIVLKKFIISTNKNDLNNVLKERKKEFKKHIMYRLHIQKYNISNFIEGCKKNDEILKQKLIRMYEKTYSDFVEYKIIYRKDNAKWWFRIS